MFSGDCTVGLGGWIGTPKAKRKPDQRKAVPHLVICAWCGAEVWTVSNTARTCGGECGRSWRNKKERRRKLIAQVAATGICRSSKGPVSYPG